jgi:cytoskeleton-associated protein 5
MSVLAEKCPSFGKSSAAIAIPHLTEKLGDLKLKKPAGETLIVFAEKTSLAFVLAQSKSRTTQRLSPRSDRFGHLVQATNQWADRKRRRLKPML